MKEVGPTRPNPRDRSDPAAPSMGERMSTLPRPLLIGGVAFVAVLFLVIVLTVLASLTSGGRDATDVPPPSDASSDEYLKLQTLDSAGEFYGGGNRTDVDAAALYRDALLRTIEANNKPPAAAVNLVIEAAQSDSVKDGFVDQLMPISGEKDSAVLDAFEALVQATVDRAINPIGSPTDGRQAGVAAVVLLQRTFTYNERLPVRNSALRLLFSLGDDLHSRAPLDRDQSLALANLLGEVTSAMRYWEVKLDVLQASPLNVSDLQVIAKNDEDASFRVEAVRRSGQIASLAPAGPQRDVIRKILDDAAQSDDPAIQKAAEYARNEMPAD